MSSKPLPARVPPVIPRNYHQMLHKGSEVVQKDEKGIKRKGKELYVREEINQAGKETEREVKGKKER